MSFIPGKIDGLEMNPGPDRAWVLYRVNHQSCMIIGIFDCRDSAFAYIEKNGPADQSEWIEPHPGQRHWQYQSEMFTYVLEQHQIRHGVGDVNDAMLQFRHEGA